MKSQIQTVAISMVSALVGALVVSFAQAKHEARPSSAPQAPASARAADKPVEVRVLAAGADPQLAQRLSALEQRVGERPAEVVDPIEEASHDREEALARAAEHRADREAKFAAEPVDRSWALDAGRRFDADFSSFEDATFKAGPMDCRSSLCRGELTFPSYDAARGAARKIVQHEYATNCTREILTPAPEDDGNAPYTATVFFDCRNLRQAPR